MTNKIRAAVAQMSGSLLESDDWFSVFERGTVSDSRVVELVEKWLSLEVKNTDFINRYSKLFEDAFLYGTGWLAFGFEEYIDYRPRTVTKASNPTSRPSANTAAILCRIIWTGWMRCCLQVKRVRTAAATCASLVKMSPKSWNIYRGALWYAGSCARA